MARPLQESFDIGRTLSHGFAALKVAPLPLLLGGVLIQCTEGGGSSGNMPSSQSTPTFPDSGGGTDFNLPNMLESLNEAITPGMWIAILAGLACLLLCVLLVFLFRCWLEPGWYRLQHEILATGQGTTDTLFGGRDALGRMIRWKLLKVLVSGGTLLVVGAPGGLLLFVGLWKGMVSVAVLGGLVFAVLALPVMIYVGLGLTFGERLVALDGMDAMTALDRSWSLASGNRLWLLLYLLVLGIVHLAGLLACCVGIFATRAIRDVALTEAFLLFTRPDEETGRYWAMSA